MAAMFRDLEWNTIIDNSPVDFTRLIDILESIEVDIKRVRIDDDNLEYARDRIFRVFPRLKRVVDSLRAIVNSAIKNEEIKLKWPGEYKFSEVIRQAGYYIEAEKKNLQDKHLIIGDNLNTGGLIACMNFIEDVVYMVYDSLMQAVSMEPKDPYRFYHALWSGVFERTTSYIKPIIETRMPGGQPVDYNELINTAEQTQGESLKPLGDIKTANDLEKLLESGELQLFGKKDDDGKGKDSDAKE